MSYAATMAQIGSLATISTGPAPGHAAGLTAASSQYLSLPSSAPFVETGHDIFAGGWVWLNSAPATTVYLISKVGGNSGVDEWALRVNPAGGGAGHPRLEAMVVAASVGYKTLTWTADIPTGQWVFCELALLTSSHDFGVGQNGAAIFQHGAVGSTLQVGTNSVQFGGTTAFASSYVDGRMDAWFVGDGDLTTPQWSSLYNAGAGWRWSALSGALQSVMVSWWDLDGPYADGLWHDAGASNHLTANNGVSITTGLT